MLPKAADVHIMQKNQCQVLYLLSLLVIYVLTLIPGLHTPFHADDYNYYLLDLSLDKRLDHYTHWSGRILADFISSSFLALLPQTVYAAINAAASVLLIALISLMPAVTFKRPLINGRSVLVLLLLYFAYWAGNTRLSETTFWMVGTANYLWPVVIVTSFLFCFFYLRGRPKLSLLSILGISVLALLGGVSNEATGASLCCFLILALADRSNSKKVTISALICALIGFSILYFAPGNRMRLKNSDYGFWENSSSFWQFFKHFYERVPNAFGEFWLVFSLILLVVLLYQALSANKEDAHKNYGFAALFFGLGLFSIIIFVKAPIMPGRALNTTLVYFLLCLSFLSYCGRGIKNIISVALASLAAFFYFVPSYYLFTSAMKSMSVQAEIRDKIIKDAIKNNQNRVEIPDWYFTKLLKGSDRPNPWHSPAMARFYGIDEISCTKVYFDYSLLKSQKPLVVNQQIREGLILENIYREEDIFGTTKLIFQFDHSPDDLMKLQENKLSIHLFINGYNPFAGINIALEGPYKIADKYYMKSSPLWIEIQNLYRIDFGLLSNQNKAFTGFGTAYIQRKP